MRSNTERTFAPEVADVFHALVKSGGKLKMHNGHVAHARRIEYTVMPLRGQWIPPQELVDALKNARWIDLD